jgi:hypothetical protein
MDRCPTTIFHRVSLPTNQAARVRLKCRLRDVAIGVGEWLRTTSGFVGMMGNYREKELWENRELVTLVGECDRIRVRTETCRFGLLCRGCEVTIIIDISTV